MPGLATIGTALIPAIAAGLQLTASAVKKVEDTAEVNQYIDLGVLQTRLFDAEKHDDAYKEVYQKAQMYIARKGIVPAVYWYDEQKGQGAPTIAVPVSLLFDLLNAAMR
jgi:hypothetical protein